MAQHRQGVVYEPGREEPNSQAGRGSALPQHLQGLWPGWHAR